AQHLIEKCLISNKTKEECMEALSKHASIQPVITFTAIAGQTKNLSNLYRILLELEVNKDFFEAYAQSQSKQDRISEAETSQMIQKTILDSPKDPDD
ncbi:Conserved hypothetical protein CHP01589, partial [Theobroma cacao]